MNQLHTALTPPERRALVDKVQAHWTVWKHVNTEEPGGRARGTRLAKLGEELSLPDDQLQKIGDALKAASPPEAARLDPARVEAHVKAFTDAFAADAFDANAIRTADGANAHVATVGAARMAHFYEVVTPLLTPEHGCGPSSPRRDPPRDHT